MKNSYLVDFIKDEEREDFKRKVATENRLRREGQFTREEVRKQYLAIAKQITDEINRLEDLYEAGRINKKTYYKKRDTLFNLREKNRETYMRSR